MNTESLLEMANLGMGYDIRLTIDGYKSALNILLKG